MRILLVQPRFGLPGRLLGQVSRRAARSQVADPDLDLIVRVSQAALPLSLEAVAGCIPGHHTVRIIDLVTEPEGALEQVLADFQPDLVGVTCMYTCAVNATLEVVRRVRAVATSAFLIIGGHVATLSPEFVAVPELDAIALGEAEVILPGLLQRLETGQDWHHLPGLAYFDRGELARSSVDPQLVTDLDHLPLLPRHLTAHYAEKRIGANRRQVSAIVSSRGCPFRCTFCAVQAVYRGRFRFMSAERVLEEITNSPGEIIGYMDDNFLAHLPRARRIATMLLERGIHKEHIFTARSDTIAKAPDLLALWAQVGLTDVFVGFESVNDDRLQALGKGSSVEEHRRAIEILHNLGVRVNGYFMIDPDFHESDFRDLQRFVTDMQVDRALYSILTPYPGTAFWDQCHGDLTTRNWDFFDNAHAVLPTYLPLPQFYRLYAELVTQTLLASGRGGQP